MRFPCRKCNHKILIDGRDGDPDVTVPAGAAYGFDEVTRKSEPCIDVRARCTHRARAAAVCTGSTAFVIGAATSLLGGVAKAVVCTGRCEQCVRRTASRVGASGPNGFRRRRSGCARVACFDQRRSCGSHPARGDVAQDRCKRRERVHVGLARGLRRVAPARHRSRAYGLVARTPAFGPAAAYVVLVDAAFRRLAHLDCRLRDAGSASVASASSGDRAVGRARRLRPARRCVAAGDGFAGCAW